EIVAAAGAFDRIVGVSNADNYPPGVADLPDFSALPVDFESVASLRPDLVLATTEVNDPRDAAMFDGLDIPIYYLSIRSLAEVFGAIETVGELLESEEAARATIDSLRVRTHRLEQLSSSVKNRPRVLFLISYETLFSFGRDSYVHDLIEIAGGESVTSDLETSAPVLSDEYVLRQAPDVIIGTFGDPFRIPDLLEAHPTWRLVPAVREGRVYSIENDLILRAGPRNIDGAYRMFELLHGDEAK
ncbi:MAG: ABC transporter substrate-binding protein, partial [Bacteroidetes bacterium]|nr:ABC transporter substrate-binding protein [Bacteroidota bacterium]